MRKIVNTAAIMLISAFVLGGCGFASFDEESGKATEAAKAAFAEKGKSPNHKSDAIDFYLPEGFEIEEESPSNIILKNGSTTYILFYNPNEDKDSQVVYDATVAQYKQPEVKEEFKSKEKVGYIVIEKMEENMNVLTAGVGGAKVTAEIKTASLEDEAATMMQIANSIEVNK